MKKVMPKYLKFALIVLTAIYIIGIATMAYLGFAGMKELMPLACNTTLLAMAVGSLGFAMLAYRRKMSMTVCHHAPSIWEHFRHLPHGHQ